jgi:hypothetical protein
MAVPGAPGTGGPSTSEGTGAGRLVLWVTAIAGAVSAVAAVLVVLFGDAGLFGPGDRSTEPTQQQPPAAATEASPPESAERATPLPDASGDPYTEAERRLARRVEWDVNEREGAISCNSTRDAERIDGALATLSCYPVNIRYPINVVVASFQNDTALDEFIESEISKLGSTTAPETLSSDGYFACPHHDVWGKSTEAGSEIIGPYSCSFDGSEYRAVWGFNNDSYNEVHGGEVFAVIASSGDRLALGDWWVKWPV